MYIYMYQTELKDRKSILNNNVHVFVSCLYISGSLINLKEETEVKKKKLQTDTMYFY